MAGTSTGDDGSSSIGEQETSSRREIGKMKTKKRRDPSVISMAIARTASKPAGVSSMDSMELIRGLYEGVLLDNDLKKFWVDRNLHKNCFMLLAEGLNILWGDDNRYWRWDDDPLYIFGGSVQIRMATLAKPLDRLDISGKFPSIMLSPMTTYEVVFLLYMNVDAEGWDTPVSLGLRLPNKTAQNRTENLGEKTRQEWLNINAGDFEVIPENVGYIEFFLKEDGVGNMKKGLVLKGVIFRPKFGRFNIVDY